MPYVSAEISRALPIYYDIVIDSVARTRKNIQDSWKTKYVVDMEGRTMPDRRSRMKAVGPITRNRSACWTLALAATILGGLLVGIEPVGGDPDRMYRPIKAELARTMAEGLSPFWSDNLGVGFPLAAEGHAAAFYPPNQVFYRVLTVPAAYRLSMFLHYLLMVGATFAYARSLRLSPQGAALGALSFTFCGFQSIHSSHEVFYHAVAYLPLCLFLAEQIMAGGGPGWIAGLGIAYGLQLTVGHFQVQSWTAGLVVATALWHAVQSPRLARRLPLALAGLAWGGAMAAIQLGPTWELARFVGYDNRPFVELAFYGFPPAHWAELIVPGWFRGIPGGPEASYWYAQGTTGYEACLYVGTIPLIFVFIGMLKEPDSGSKFWTVIALLSFVMAILPAASPSWFEWVTTIPGLDMFRAPGRCLAVTSLGLALLAGKGMDRTDGRMLAWLAFGLSLAFAAGGIAWVVSWSWRPDHFRELGGDRLWFRLAAAGGVWLAAAILTAAWLRGRLPGQILLIVTACELGVLYYTSTTDWGWAVDVPASSPILTKLAEEPGVGKVAGMLSDIPLRIGVAALYPYTGFPPPPPHIQFMAFTNRDASSLLRLGHLTGVLPRFGATHGVWDVPIESPDAELVAEGPDETLDRIVSRPPGSAPHSKWRLYRFKNLRPQAVAVAAMLALRPREDGRNDALRYDFRESPVAAAKPPPADLLPNAARAELVSWDGRTAIVEHDGPCHVLINRTYYPGWTYRVDGGPSRPVLLGCQGLPGDRMSLAESGVQAAFVPGSGSHRVEFTYRPTNLAAYASTSAGASVLALIVLGCSARKRRSAPAEQDPQRQDDDAGHHGLHGG